ncbi:MAG: DUF2189 domain-containing protein [Thalassovita sp.]
MADKAQQGQDPRQEQAHDLGLEHGAPQFRSVDLKILRQALHLGWADMRRAPVLGAVFAGVYVLLGLVMTWVTLRTGQSYWLVFAAVGFPLVGPFTAVGLYEVSRELERGKGLDFRRIFGVILQQSRRQLPSMSAIIIFIFLFWFFLAHMIFALFMGTMTMTNVSTSFEVFQSVNGVIMLGIGTVIGAGFALLLYMITVVSLPMLLDRELDYVTAMVTSFVLVRDNAIPMLFWGLFIAVLTFVAMLPGFLGLFIALPLLGHATWHLYSLLRLEPEHPAPGS